MIPLAFPGYVGGGGLPQGPDSEGESCARPLLPRHPSRHRSPLTITNTDAFNLPDRLSAKAHPALIARDRQQFATIADSLQQQIDDLTYRLTELRLQAGGSGQAAMDRDIEIHRVTSQLRVLRRYGLDLCLGRVVREGEEQPLYIGRLGLTDDEGRQLMVD